MVARKSRSYYLFLPFFDSDPSELDDDKYFSKVNNFFTEIYRLNRLHAKLDFFNDALLNEIINESFLKKEFSVTEIQHLRRWFTDRKFQVILASLDYWYVNSNHLRHLIHAKYSEPVARNDIFLLDQGVTRSTLILIRQVLAAFFIDSGPVYSSDFLSCLLQGENDFEVELFFEGVLRFIKINEILGSAFEEKSITDISKRDLEGLNQEIDSDSLKLIKSVYLNFANWINAIENNPSHRVIHFISYLHDYYYKNEKNINPDVIGKLLLLTPFYGVSDITDSNHRRWMHHFVKILTSTLLAIVRPSELPDPVLKELRITFAGSETTIFDEVMTSARLDPFFQVLWHYFLVLGKGAENCHDFMNRVADKLFCFKAQRIAVSDLTFSSSAADLIQANSFQLILDERKGRESLKTIAIVTHNLIDFFNADRCKSINNEAYCLRRNSVLCQPIFSGPSFCLDATPAMQKFQEKKKTVNNDIKKVVVELSKKRMHESKRVELAQNILLEKVRQQGEREGVKKHQTLVRSYLKKIGLIMLGVIGVALLAYLSVQTAGIAPAIIGGGMALYAAWGGGGIFAATGILGLFFQTFKKRNNFSSQTVQNSHLLNEVHIRQSESREQTTLSTPIQSEIAEPVAMTVTLPAISRTIKKTDSGRSVQSNDSGYMPEPRSVFASKLALFRSREEAEVDDDDEAILYGGFSDTV